MGFDILLILHIFSFSYFAVVVIDVIDCHCADMLVYKHIRRVVIMVVFGSSWGTGKSISPRAGELEIDADY